MIFPKEFKQKVEELFPNDEKINQILEAGNPVIGRYLEDTKNSNRVKDEDILKAKSLKALKERADKNMKIQDVLTDFWKLFDK